jgi:predicted alpha/beta-hydrolase family hydrolase
MTYLLLTHGAGSNRNAPMLVALASAFAEHQIEVVRYDLPFRQARAHGPPRPSEAARDRDGLRAEILKLRAKHPDQIWLGGQSYGGRQASILASEDTGLADRLLLLSYPLHAPGKPDKLRTAHFPQLQTPALFVHGTRDPFATTEEMQSAITLIPAPVQLLEVEGAGHDLGRDRAGMAARIVTSALNFFPKISTTPSNNREQGL